MKRGFVLGAITTLGVFLLGVLRLGHGYCAEFDSPFVKRMLERHKPHPVLNVADKGASQLAPENTLPAIEKAFMLGADIVRVGVHLSKDEALVVLQDHDLRRTTNVRRVFPDRGSTLVRDFTLSEIKLLDAGSYFIKQDPYGTLRSGLVSPQEADLYGSGAIKVPTLDEALELAKRYEAALDIEIRQLPAFYPKIGSLVLEAIKRSRMEESVIVSSLDHTLLYEMKKENGKIDFAPIMLERLYLPARYAKDYLGMRLYETAYDLAGVELGYPKNEADFEDANKRKAGAFVWGVNRADMYPVLLRLGVAGMITQRTDDLEDYLDRLFGNDKER